MKNLLILCIGNPCRSIMAETAINAQMGHRILVQSLGVKASGKVNPHAQALLKSKGCWEEAYDAKTLPLIEEKLLPGVNGVLDV